jgi:hypothetical protein
MPVGGLVANLGPHPPPPPQPQSCRNPKAANASTTRRPHPRQCFQTSQQSDLERRRFERWRVIRPAARLAYQQVYFSLAVILAVPYPDSRASGQPDGCSGGWGGVCTQRT